jgi:hypothetical protein
MTAGDLPLTLPADTLAAIAERAADLLEQRLGRERSPWMNRAEAATYLGVPVSRLEKRKEIPSHRDDGRVLYHRDELDAYMLAKPGDRPVTARRRRADQR